RTSSKPTSRAPSVHDVGSDEEADNRFRFGSFYQPKVNRPVDPLQFIAPTSIRQTAANDAADFRQQVKHQADLVRQQPVKSDGTQAENERRIRDLEDQLRRANAAAQTKQSAPFQNPGPAPFSMGPLAPYQDPASDPYTSTVPPPTGRQNSSGRGQNYSSPTSGAQNFSQNAPPFSQAAPNYSQSAPNFSQSSFHQQSTHFGGRQNFSNVPPPQQAYQQPSYGGYQSQPPQQAGFYGHPPGPPGQHAQGPPGRVGYVDAFEQKPLTKVKDHKFDNKPGSNDWINFRACFKAAVGDRLMQDGQKLMMLLDMLEDEPKRIALRVAGEDYDTASYIRTWNTLEETFGGITRARQGVYHEMQTFPKIKKFTYTNALELSAILQRVLARYANANGVVFDHSVLNEMAKRLIPPEEVTRYFSELSRIRQPDTLENFAAFIEDTRVNLYLTYVHQLPDNDQKTFCGQDEPIYVAHNEPVYVDRNEVDNSVLYGQQPRNSWPPKREAPPVAQTVVGPQTTRQSLENRAPPPSIEDGLVVKPKKPTPPCLQCSSPHPLWSCEDFSLQPLKLRYQIVKNNKLCFHCLGFGHIAKVCKFQAGQKCGLENCERYHHKKLHNFKILSLVTIEEYLILEQNVETVEDVNAQCNHVQTIYAEKGDYVAIRTSTLYIIGPDNKRRRIVAALDSCSNSTNIDADLAEELGLRVEKTGLVRDISFLQSSDSVNSDYVSFALSPFDSSAIFPIKAFTVENILAKTPVIDWKKVATDFPHLRQAEFPDPDPRDKVQILLGTDYAHLMTSAHSLINRDFEPVAEYTKLGWAFSGR
ncbi:MAG: hypothetical protein ACOYB2_19805, partial [Limnohabitans sp.]